MNLLRSSVLPLIFFSFSNLFLLKIQYLHLNDNYPIQ